MFTLARKAALLQLYSSVPVVTHTRAAGYSKESVTRMLFQSMKVS